jgi:hypothetical protein
MLFVRRIKIRGSAGYIGRDGVPRFATFGFAKRIAQFLASDCNGGRGMRLGAVTFFISFVI